MSMTLSAGAGSCVGLPVPSQAMEASKLLWLSSTNAGCEGWGKAVRMQEEGISGQREDGWWVGLWLVMQA